MKSFKIKISLLYSCSQDFQAHVRVFYILPWDICLYFDMQIPCHSSCNRYPCCPWKTTRKGHHGSVATPSPPPPVSTNTLCLQPYSRPMKSSREQHGFRQCLKVSASSSPKDKTFYFKKKSLRFYSYCIAWNKSVWALKALTSAQKSWRFYRWEVHVQMIPVAKARYVVQ